MFLEIYDSGGPIVFAAAVFAIGALDFWIFSWSARVTPEEPPPGGLFGRVARGYFWSVNLLALPIVLLTCIQLVLREGEVLEIIAVVALPIIVFGQAILLGLLVVIGDRLRSSLIARVRPAPRSRAA